MSWLHGSRRRFGVGDSDETVVGIVQGSKS